MQIAGPFYAVSEDESRVLGRGNYGIVYKGYKIQGSTKIPVGNVFEFYMYTMMTFVSIVLKGRFNAYIPSSACTLLLLLPEKKENVLIFLH